MSELYAFLFCLLLGAATRLLYCAFSALAKRTNIYPVTVILDAIVMLMAGGAFCAYVVLSGATLAPYMFAAAGSAYYFTYLLTRRARR